MIPVLIIEDDPAFRSFMAAALGAHGFHVVEAGTLVEAERLASVDVAAILLDLDLPDGDGLDLLRRLAPRSAARVIVVSARDATEAMLTAIESGADDYLLKPVDTRTMLARLNALLRTRRGTSVIDAGPIRIDLARSEVTVEGRPVELTATEQRVLGMLARRAGAIVTYRQLLEEIWGTHDELRSPELRMQVASLRRKLESESARPRWLVSELGVGYRLKTG